jgi:hypothetical protein
MRSKPAIILTACVLASSPAFAADQQTHATQQAPLAPGHAAGVQKAEMAGPSTAVWIAGGAIVAAGIILVASNHGGGHGPSTTAASGSH